MTFKPAATTIKNLETHSELSLSGQVLKALVLFGLLLAFYLPHLIDLVQAWSFKPQSSHGYFVIPICFYLCWQRRKRIHAFLLRSESLGIVLLVIGLLLGMLGFLGHISSIINISFMISLAGITIATLGLAILRVFFFPYLFLLFMFPIPDALYVSLTAPLKLFVTEVSTYLIKMFGEPVFQAGNLIQLANFQVEVVEACSGMRSLTTYLMLGTLLASFMNASYLIKGALLAFTIPIAFINNILRITITAFLADWCGAKVANAYLHTLTGLSTFALGLFLLFISFRLLSGKRHSTIELAEHRHSH